MVKVMGVWAFDVFTQIAAFSGPTETAAQAVLRNIGLYTFMVPLGLSSSANYFVGHYIGKGKPL
jgi:Na+-driven multidrug efflux pump